MTEKEASFILANIDRRVCDDELNDALDMAIKALEQKPCDAISRQAVIDLATTIKTDDYSGNEILEVVEVSDIKKLPPVTPTEPKTDGDCIRREDTIEVVRGHWEEIIHPVNLKIQEELKALPSVNPQEKTGHWIYDKSIENWKCSECGETPKTLGYVGSANFMKEHFKFCNHCGCRMSEVEE